MTDFKRIFWIPQKKNIEVLFSGDRGKKISTYIKNIRKVIIWF